MAENKWRVVRDYLIYETIATSDLGQEVFWPKVQTPGTSQLVSFGGWWQQQVVVRTRRAPHTEVHSTLCRDLLVDVIVQAVQLFVPEILPEGRTKPR